MILRLQTEEELAALQQKLKAKLPSKIHVSELRTNTGTEFNKEAWEAQKVKTYKALPDGVIQAVNAGVLLKAKLLKIPSKTRQKRARRISGYVSEAEILKSILGYLRLHPRVSWVVRINSGALRYENRFIKFGQPGFPDVIGQTKEGLLIGIEVKASNGKASPDQQAFIDKINESGGLGCIAKSIDDVKALLA